MKLLMGLLAAMLLLAGVGTSHAAVRIANDQADSRPLRRTIRAIESLRPNNNDRWPLRFVLHDCPRRDPSRKNLCNSKR